MEEVPQMTMRVTRSMMEAGLSSLRFVCRPLAEDPQLKPYMDVMHGASLAAGIALRLVDYPAGAI